MSKQTKLNPSLEQCYNQGGTHAAYGWKSNPWDNWNEEQKKAYYKGYNNYKEPLEKRNPKS